MVGEIRDLETTQISIRASLTGHLVLSTVHTNSAGATVTRLINMDVEPFLIASTVLAIESQRLLRKVCSKCRQEVKYPDEVLMDAGLEPGKIDYPLVRGEGCEHCRGTGYKGRIGIFENMMITAKIRDLILKGATSEELEKTAVEQGMETLHDSAIRKLEHGLTSVEEVIRETKLREAMQERRETGQRLVSVLNRLEMIPESKLLAQLSNLYKMEVVDLDYIIPEKEVLEMIPAEKVYHYEVLPIDRKGRYLTVAMVDPTDISAIEDLRFITSIRASGKHWIATTQWKKVLLK
jgi:type II secretory ATPase GspE/PulE/Tfp pilus assembly ATPase PilB-like protein